MLEVGTGPGPTDRADLRVVTIAPADRGGSKWLTLIRGNHRAQPLELHEELAAAGKFENAADLILDAFLRASQAFGIFLDL